MNDKARGQRIVSCLVNPGEKDIRSKAMRTLSGTGAKLFFYLLDMAEVEGGKAVFPLRWNDVCMYTGMSRCSFFIAFNEMANKGYLIQDSIRKYMYRFNGRQQKECV